MMTHDEMLSRIDIARMHIKFARELLRPVTDEMLNNDDIWDVRAYNCVLKVVAVFHMFVKEIGDLDFLVHEKTEGKL
jgi:hypothetical protein